MKRGAARASVAQAKEGEELDRLIADLPFEKFNGTHFENLSPEAAEKSFAAKMELYRLYQAAPNKDAFRDRVIARAKGNAVVQAQLKIFFHGCEPVEQVRGMSGNEVDVITHTGWTYNQVGYGTFAVGANTEAFTNVKEYAVRLPGVKGDLKGDDATGPFRTDGPYLKFQGIMSESQREAIRALMKKTFPGFENEAVDGKVDALYRQSQEGKTREFLLFFNAPKFLFETASYDYSISNQGAVLPTYEYIDYLQKATGGKKLTRADFDTFVYMSRKTGPQENIEGVIKRVFPDATDFTRKVLMLAHGHQLGKFSASFLDMKKTLETNRTRLRPEAYKQLLKHCADLAGVKSANPTEKEILEAWEKRPPPR